MIEPKLEVPAELRDLAEKTIDQAEKAFGMFFDAANNDFQKVLPSGTSQIQGKLTRNESGADNQHEHQGPCEDNGAVELENPALPEDHLIGTQVHD